MSLIPVASNPFLMSSIGGLFKTCLQLNVKSNCLTFTFFCFAVIQMDTPKVAECLTGCWVDLLKLYYITQQSEMRAIPSPLELSILNSENYNLSGRSFFVYHTVVMTAVLTALNCIASWSSALNTTVRFIFKALYLDLIATALRHSGRD